MDDITQVGVRDRVWTSLSRAIERHCQRAWGQRKWLVVTPPKLEDWPEEYSYKFRYIEPFEPTLLGEIVYRPHDQ